MNEIQKFAKEHCANFHGQDKCLMEPAGGLTCALFRGEGKVRCPVGCPGTEKSWFEEAVLPMNQSLEARYWRQVNGNGEEESKMANCVKCGHEYKRTSNRQRYCSKCRKQVRRETVKTSMRKHRSESKSQDGTL